jgi:hypothetical protein
MEVIRVTRHWGLLQELPNDQFSRLRDIDPAAMSRFS